MILNIFLCNFWFWVYIFNHMLGPEYDNFPLLNEKRYMGNVMCLLCAGSTFSIFALMDQKRR